MIYIYIYVFLDWYQTSTSSQSAIYLDYYTKHYVHICIRSDFVKCPEGLLSTPRYS